MQDALDKIRHHRLAGALQPATVTLCPGPHHVEGLTLDPATDSNIAWESVDPRAPAVVTAGVAITGWSQDGSGAWSAPFPAAFQQQRGAAAADPNPEPARPFGVRQLWGPDGTRRKRQTLEGAVCGGVADYALGCSAFALPHGNGGGSMNLTASLPSEFPGFTANTSWPALHWNASTSVEAVFSRSGAWRRAACGVRRAACGVPSRRSAPRLARPRGSCRRARFCCTAGLSAARARGDTRSRGGACAVYCTAGGVHTHVGPRAMFLLERQLAARTDAGTPWTEARCRVRYTEAVPGTSAMVGVIVPMATCPASPGAKWTLTSAGQIRSAAGMCLAADVGADAGASGVGGANVSSGTRVVLRPCSAAPGPGWEPLPTERWFVDSHSRCVKRLVVLLWPLHIYSRCTCARITRIAAEAHFCKRVQGPRV